MKIQIINGPNINLLGKREPGIYGSTSFEDYLLQLRVRYPQVQIDYFQSNVEGFMIDKIHEELTSDDATLTWMEAGSMAQNKTVVNPLLAQYDKCQKTQILFYKAMGLSYDATPSKIAGNRGGRDESDPMSEYFSAMQESGKNI